MSDLTLLCDLPRERSNLYTLEIASDGRAMSLFAYPAPAFVDANGQDSAFFFTHVQCIVTELGAPTSVWQKISNTQGSDGQQHAEWDGFSIDWEVSALPMGLDVAITQTG
jgi:hypothetical protein